MPMISLSSDHFSISFRESLSNSDALHIHIDNRYTDIIGLFSRIPPMGPRSDPDLNRQGAYISVSE